MAGEFDKGPAETDSAAQIKELEAKIGPLTLENVVLEGALGKLPRCERQKMIDPGSDLPVTRQAWILKMSRSSVDYAARPSPDRDLKLMRRLDELHLKWPRPGSRDVIVP